MGGFKFFILPKKQKKNVYVYKIQAMENKT